jgi:hypothetical protein
VSTRWRILSFGSAALLVVAGIVCAIVVDGFTGQILTVSLVTAGVGAALLLVFAEVGLSEEHALAREDEQRRQRDRPPRPPKQRPLLGRRPRRPH